MSNEKRTVGDILESYGLDDEVDSTLELIHNIEGDAVSKINATPAIVVHTIHTNTKKDWYTICEELGVDSGKVLKYRQKLVDSGVLSSDIRKPSQLSRGEVSELLSELEHRHSDEIFDGTNPKSWVAAATYLNEYIHIRETPIEEIADQFDCNVGTIVKYVDRMVMFDSFDRAISGDDIDGSLGALLSRRRRTIESMRYTLGDTSNGVRKRLTSLEKNSDLELFSEFVADKQFYWVEDAR